MTDDRSGSRQGWVREGILEKKTVYFKVTGRVQGVFYRQSTRYTAQNLGLTGFVRNLADGSVEGLAHGDGQSLAVLLDYCRKGPPNAQVEQLVERFLEEAELSAWLANFSAAELPAAFLVLRD